ncbi:2-amino-4-hydroxy-6-hydroxymethyldihydropteridine diphosphokinase [Acidisphaera sp. L21]|uniref:2-amino-4-hydroxy-6- hydroxymethyldihydropteridine diphosphokinase n=1 Tax=Acidisphaera sp. L21 TaxID=1641851 RepID=UPI00131BA7C1|nr:2-amino-4-hydroxy-6-hydroxymethyldihydropteridine diphosphokinase [Acidisphaera sp. L21]
MILVALGANLPTQSGIAPLETCRRAAAALDGLVGLRCVALSRWFATQPMPPSGQPPYINGVARLEGMVDPAVLLAALQAVELAHGRQRSTPNAARTLDLDIIAMGDLVRTAPDPTIPHPRMHERAFVLAPLLDVAPNWRHPVLNQSARALLDALEDQGARPLTSSHLRDDGPKTI